MFSTLSKIISFFLELYNLIFLAIIVYFLLSKSKSNFLRQISSFFGIVALIAIIIGGFKPISNYLIWKFENIIDTQIPENPDGIILLGGSFTGLKKALDKNQVGLNSSSERVVEALRLLTNNKKTKLLFVADATASSPDKVSAAEQAKTFFGIFKINTERLVIRKIANNTYEESIEIAKHLKQNGGRWILITSAIHMPRSISLMQSRDIGDSIIYPYPTDFQSSIPKFNFNFSFNNFQKLDSLTHEIVGLLAYRITGRTKTLFPNLNLIPVNFN